MGRLLFFLTFFYVGFCVPGLAAAQSLDINSTKGSDLFLLCNSKYDTDYGYCAGFVSAIADIMVHQDVNGLRACHIEVVKSQQLVDIVQVYLTSNPELHSYTAKELVARAFARAFPCL